MRIHAALLLGASQAAVAFTFSSSNLGQQCRSRTLAQGSTDASRPSAKRMCGGPLRMAAKDAEAEEEVDISQLNKGRENAPTWMFNSEGRALAPWMLKQFEPEALAKVEQSKLRRKAMEQERMKNAVGALAEDPQQMELSGLGLKYKMVGGEVELTWKTGDETGNKGFVVQKRKGKTEDWVQVASYKDWQPLNSKGPEGGVYSFVDPSTEEGTWIYRISDVGKDGSKNDLCQALIEVQSPAEAMQAKIAVAGLLIVAAGILAVGASLDPMQ